MAVHDPQRLLKVVEELTEQHITPSDRRKLLQAKAKAMVSLHQYTEAEKEVLNLLEEAIEVNDLEIIAKSNIILSKCYVNLNLPNREKPCLDVAMAAAKQARNNDLITIVLSHYAAMYQRQHDRTQTLLYLEKAEKQLDKDSDPYLRLNLLIDTGTAYYHFQQYDKAIFFISSALELSHKMKDLNNQMTLLNNLSTLYSLVGRYTEAEEMLKRGLSLSEEHDIPFQKVQFLFNLGVLNMRQDKYTEALRLLLDCEQAAKSFNLTNISFWSDLNSNLAGCYRYLGEVDLAWQRLEEARRVLADSADTNTLQELDLNKANYLISLGKYSESRKLLKSVIKYATKNKLFDVLITAQLSLHESYKKANDYVKACSCLLDLHRIHLEYQQYLMTEQTKDYDQRIQILMQDYNEVQQQYSSLQQDIRNYLGSEFVGKSKAHQKVLEAALLAAQHPNASVLLIGESGTGKDVIARMIHNNSARRDAQLIAVNMAAISPNLLESEFFGHKKGSFTGAISDTKGFFLEANQGSLFLDEISEMPFNLQAKLLRVLESRKLTPVGSSRELAFDTRVISSTNRDIMQMIRNDQFRLDLYHRLNTIEIHVPPLRERPEDIEVLVLHYTEKLARELKMPVPKIALSFFQALQQYSFPGNVRELKNVIERLLILQSGTDWDNRILNKLPSLKLGIQSKPDSTIKSRKEKLEKEEIIEALQKCSGKQKAAAKLLGISESTLTRRIVAYNLEIYTRKGR